MQCHIEKLALVGIGVAREILGTTNVGLFDSSTTRVGSTRAAPTLVSSFDIDAACLANPIR